MSWLVIMLTCIICHKFQSCPWYEYVIIFGAEFVFTFFAFGVQSVFLYVPHEYKEHTTQSLSIFYSLLWGCAYILVTFYYIFIAAVHNSIMFSNQTPLVITVAAILYLYFSKKIRESRPNWPTFPQRKAEFWANEELLDANTKS